MKWIATRYGNDSGKLGLGERTDFSNEIAQLSGMTLRPIGSQHFGELCTCLPEVVELAEEQGWDVDFYQTSFYSA